MKESETFVLPIIGHRVWRVLPSGVIVPICHGGMYFKDDTPPYFEWHKRKPMQAACYYDNPYPCAHKEICGIHAYKTAELANAEVKESVEYLMSTGTMGWHSKSSYLFGEVYLWGRVWEHWRLSAGNRS